MELREYQGIDFEAIRLQANEVDGFYTDKVRKFIKLLNESKQINSAVKSSNSYRFCRIFIQLVGDQQILIQLVKGYSMNEIQEVKDVTPIDYEA